MATSVTNEDLVFAPSQESRQTRLGREEAARIYSGLGEKPYTTVVVGGVSLGPSAATVVSEELSKLAKLHSLTNLSLADCIATLSEEDAIRSLSLLLKAAVDCRELSSLDLSDNALGSKGLATCGPLFLSTEHHIRHLYLCRCGLGPDAARLVQSLLTSARANTDLVTLHIENNLLMSQGVLQVATLVEKSPEMRDLRLSSLRAGPDSILQVLVALASHVSSLEVLDLSDNSCDIDCALMLNEVLKANKNLAHLVLRDMSINDDAAYVVLKALTETEVNVKFLDLSGNDLTACSASPLEAFLSKKAKSLKTLSLNENEFDDGAAGAIVNGVEFGNSETLTHFGLASNALTDVGAATLACAVEKLPSFEELDLRGNQLSSRTIDALQKVLGNRVLVPDLDDEHSYQDSGERSDDSRSTIIEESAPEASDVSDSALGRLRELSQSLSVTTGERDDSAASKDVFESRPSSMTAFSKYVRRPDVDDGMVEEERRRESPSGELSVTSHMTSPTSPVDEIQVRDSEKVSAEEISLTPQQFYSSAQKLKHYSDSVDREAMNLMQDLSMRRDSLSVAEGTENVNRTLAVTSTTSTQQIDITEFQSKSFGEDLQRMLWAFVIGLFVFLVVAGIVQSQDEMTLSLRPV